MAASSWIVILPVANMHSAPSQDAGVVSQAIYATAVVSLAAEGSWRRIKTPDNYDGWALESSLRPQARSYGEYGRVTCVESLFANLYREPSVVSHAPLLTLPFETRLEIIEEPEEEDRRWVRVRLPDERESWIQRGDLRFDDAPLSIGETVALARRFIGLPYLWGGTSPFGYDCSGFTQMLCRRRGFSIPRDAAPQARWEGMRELRRGDLQAGDLVYFGQNAAKITHTGFCAGGGAFIHATTWRKPRVQVSRLDEPHWSELLVACRRPREESA